MNTNKMTDLNTQLTKQVQAMTDASYSVNVIYLKDDPEQYALLYRGKCLGMFDCMDSLRDAAIEHSVNSVLKVIGL